MKAKKTLLLIDGNNLFYRAYHKLSTMRFAGESTGGIYGAPSMVLGLLNKFRPTKFYLVYDGKKSPYRLALCPEYKAHRDKTRGDKEDMLRQLGISRDILHAMGIPQVKNIRNEADDIIAKLAIKYSEKGYSVTIVSSDKDFVQLIGPKVKVYNAISDVIISSANCEKLMGYTPENCVDYLSILGDKSDNIPGVRGMGEKRTQDFFSEFGNVDSYFASGKLTHKLITPAALPTIEKNRKLIGLRHYLEVEGDTVKVKYINGERFPQVDLKALRKLCAKSGIKRFLESDNLSNLTHLNKKYGKQH